MRRLILVVIAIAAVAALARFADLSILTTAFTDMSSGSLLLLMSFLLLGAIVKSVRFAFYLRAAKLDIRWRDGMSSYLAALSVAALPGGGWLSARLAQEHGHVRMRQAATAMYVSFVGDAIAVSVLAYGILLYAREPAIRFIVPGAGVVFAIFLVTMGRSQRVWDMVSRLLAKKRFTQRLLPQEEDVHARILAVMQLRVIVGGVLFSMTTTLVSALTLWVLVGGLTFRGISYFEGVTIMAMSEATAIVIPVPSGIGVSDTSMAAQLNVLAIGFLRATYVALAYRSMDLLFKTVFGTTVLVLLYNRLLMQILHVRRRARKAYRVAIQVGQLSFSIPMGVARVLWRLHATSAPITVTYESRGVPQRHRQPHEEQPPAVNPADFVSGFGIVVPISRRNPENPGRRHSFRYWD